MKGIYYFLLLIPYIVLGQSTDQNSVKTINYKTATSTAISNPTALEADVNIVYYDGLGRPVQEIAHSQSASGKDIYIPLVYDTAGRNNKEYLPFPSQTSAMDFINTTTLITNIENYYLTQYPTEGQNPYTETLYDNSPLNRIIEQGSPGTDWKANPISDADHTIKYEYLLNAATTTERVKLFKATATWNATYEMFTIALVNSAGTTYYPEDKLSKTVIKDENWTSGKNNTTEEYKDFDGKIILKRSFNNNTPHDTYYVYDQFANLTYIIPPLASGVSVTSTVLNNLCYQYRYDISNRLVEKKLPGKQWEYLVYDINSRIVATGPTYSPFGAGTSGWMVTKYDALNRSAFSGWYTASSFSSTARKTLQTSYNGTITNAIRGNSTVDGINIKYNPMTLPTGFKLLTVNYYDDYVFLDSSLTPLPSNIEGIDIITPSTAITTKGLITGGWVRVLTTSSSTAGELSYILYDNKSRAIRTYKKSHLVGGYNYTDSKLTFNGLPEYTINRQKLLSSSTEIYTKDIFSYTDQGLLLKHMHQIGASGTPQLLSKNEYNDLGGLVTKKTGGIDATAATYYQKIDFGYNIRGWLKSINNISNLNESSVPTDLFAFKINYNTTEGNAISGVTNLYNGNISETYWKSGSDNILRKYGYGYDKMDRLEKAIYQKPGSSIPITNSYNESITYDKNGNITSLYRNGSFDSQSEVINIDDLVYEYSSTSNQLLKVYDESNSTQGFTDDSDGTNDTNQDYQYDLNGNMVSDENKK